MYLRAVTDVRLSCDGMGIQIKAGKSMTLPALVGNWLLERGHLQVDSLELCPMRKDTTNSFRIASCATLEFLSSGTVVP